MPDVIDLMLILTEEPKRVFAAWMDPREHAQFTGGGLATIEPWTGGRFTAFEGDVHGIFLGVDNGARIVQTWRTPEFPPESRDSRLTVTFEAAPGGTKLRIQHADVPARLLRKLQKGWESFYLKPLSKYFVPGMKAGGKKPKAGAAAPALPAKVAKAAAPAKAVKPAKPVKAGKQPKVIKPAKAAKPAKVAKSAKPARAAKSARPAAKKKTAAKPKKPAARAKPKKAAVKKSGQKRSSRS